jgi:RimJ/RimL family protein N-acetyltransferase
MVDTMRDDAIIETQRLHLVVLEASALEALRSHDRDTAAHLQGFEFSDEFLATVNDVFLSRQIEGHRRNPTSRGWYARGIVRRDDGALIGHCGFHGTPGDVGRAEIGYTVFAPYRRKGYASEAAQGLVTWARSQGSPIVFAAISPDNHASLALVGRLGFQRSPADSTRAAGEDLLFELRL